MLDGLDQRCKGPQNRQPGFQIRPLLGAKRPGI
jgi:hypothetical protein